jgi:hypothetical protein
MAGMTVNGFIPLNYGEIVERIEAKLEVFSPGFDFSPESPDGQMIGIMAFEIAAAWSELNLVYNSYDPNQAVGQGLVNIGQLCGIPYGAATRSYATVDILGDAETIVPKGSLVSDDAGNLFQTELRATIPAGVRAFAQVSGNIPVGIGALTTVVSSVPGWTGIDQPAVGVVGGLPQTQTEYRNLRNGTVQRRNVGMSEAIQSGFLDLGIEQAVVVNNDSSSTLPDGTPSGGVSVTVGEVGAVTNLDIAESILLNNSIGCLTYGTTIQNVLDSQGISHDIHFTKAADVGIFVSTNVTFLDPDTAGLVELIKQSLETGINALLAGDDVIWSRLFELITPYGKAQVNSLTIGKSLGTLAAANILIDIDEYASTTIGSIEVVVT